MFVLGDFLALAYQTSHVIENYTILKEKFSFLTLSLIIRIFMIIQIRKLELVVDVTAS